MALEIFGFGQSRAFRTLWMAEEIKAATGRAFTHEGLIPQPGPQLDALLALNPMGQVPVIRDDDFILCESMAINLYLAKKYGVLALNSLEEEALAWQWSFWVMTAVEEHTLAALKYSLGVLGVEKDAEKSKEAMQSLSRPFNVLENRLDIHSSLVGNEFNVSDLNVASVLIWLRMANIDISHYRAIDAWLEQCSKRPAVMAARQH